MDTFIAIYIFFAIIIIGLPISLYCCWCWMMHSKSVQFIKRVSEEAPVIVTSTTTTAPGGYPVTVQATPGGGLQATPYPAPMQMPQPGNMMAHPPYPTHGGPMPQPYVQGYPSNPPYPPGGGPGQMNPPSYDQVVGSDPFQKQAPYNPNYTGNQF